MNPIEQFLFERHQRILSYSDSEQAEWRRTSHTWQELAVQQKYMYNFDWLGRPVIQFPQDIHAIQEIVWSTRPDLIIETGIAHGGSLILSASLLAMLDMCDAIGSGATIDPRASKRRVLGVDIDIRSHNRRAIETHPMSSRISMLTGSSIAAEIVEQVAAFASGYGRVMVCLDSMHTHDHVLAELQAYGPLVTKGCYCVVFDTFVEDLPHGFFADRPWDVGDNPKTAVREYLRSHSEFEIDKQIENKLLVTAAPDGFLKRIA